MLGECRLGTAHNGLGILIVTWDERDMVQPKRISGWLPQRLAADIKPKPCTPKT